MLHLLSNLKPLYSFYNFPLPNFNYTERVSFLYMAFGLCILSLQHPSLSLMVVPRVYLKDWLMVLGIEHVTSQSVRCDTSSYHQGAAHCLCIKQIWAKGGFLYIKRFPAQIIGLSQPYLKLSFPLIGRVFLCMVYEDIITAPWIFFTKMF